MALFWIDRARHWYSKHQQYVDKLVLGYDGNGFRPCDEDKCHPELWKPGSWLWFLTVHRE